ncbi:MAG TPA: response regulator transcription factor [Myxococcota bacterium]|jgi:two-component system OmpR family response regulator
MKVLYVEDDGEARELIARFLGEAGLSVETAHDGRLGLERALARAYDALVLDVKLPGMDGFEIIRRIRAAGVSTPVLCLTALGEVASRVRGLELGADDYLAKPFALAELLARIRALVRRRERPLASRMQVGDLCVDISAHQVRRAGKTIVLTPREFDLLAYLMRNEGSVVSRQMIVERVWGEGFDSYSNAIDVHVNNLRNKVDKPFELRLIHTLKGVGYVVEDRSRTARESA